MSEWTISKHTNVDKRFYINTPDENFRLIVDNDDVLFYRKLVLPEWPDIDMLVIDP